MSAETIYLFDRCKTCPVAALALQSSQRDVAPGHRVEKAAIACLVAEAHFAYTVVSALSTYSGDIPEFGGQERFSTTAGGSTDVPEDCPQLNADL